jgi:hypothetical protein
MTVMRRFFRKHRNIRQILLAITVSIYGLIFWSLVRSDVVGPRDNFQTDLRLTIAGRVISYSNFKDEVQLQDWIDYNPKMAGTCGFQAPQDNLDGKSSYFCGHDSLLDGCFEILKLLPVGEPIEVTDVNGTSRTYHIETKFIANDDTKRWTTGQRIEVFSSNREQIVLQTCMTETDNMIVIAR